MAKRYLEVLIRPAWLVPLAEGAFDAGNLLDFDRLELPAPGAKFTDEGIPLELGDGTQYWDGRKISLEASTYRTDATEYAYLRSTFHGKNADVLLYDPEQPNMMILAHGLTLSVSKLFESGNTIVCKISGSREMATGANAALVQYGGAAETMTIYGTVTDKATGDPIVGATVTTSWVLPPSYTWLESADTDKDGNYYFLVPKSNEVGYIAAAADGYDHSDEITLNWFARPLRFDFALEDEEE